MNRNGSLTVRGRATSEHRRRRPIRQADTYGMVYNIQLGIHGQGRIILLRAVPASGTAYNGYDYLAMINVGRYSYHIAIFIYIAVTQNFNNVQ